MGVNELVSSLFLNKVYTVEGLKHGAPRQLYCHFLLPLPVNALSLASVDVASLFLLLSAELKIEK